MKKWFSILLIIIICLGFTDATSTSSYASSSKSKSSSSSSSKGGFAVLLAGPAFFVIMKRKYNASNERSSYELDTECNLSDMRGEDIFIKTIKKSNNSTIDNYSPSTLKGTAGLANLLSSSGIKSLINKE